MKVQRGSKCLSFTIACCLLGSASIATAQTSPIVGCEQINEAKFIGANPNAMYIPGDWRPASPSSIGAVPTSPIVTGFTNEDEIGEGWVGGIIVRLKNFGSVPIPANEISVEPVLNYASGLHMINFQKFKITKPLAPGDSTLAYIPFSAPHTNVPAGLVMKFVYRGTQLPWLCGRPFQVRHRPEFDFVVNPLEPRSHLRGIPTFKYVKDGDYYLFLDLRNTGRVAWSGSNGKLTLNLHSLSNPDRAPYVIPVNGSSRPPGSLVTVSVRSATREIPAGRYLLTMIQGSTKEANGTDTTLIGQPVLIEIEH